MEEGGLTMDEDEERHELADEDKLDVDDEDTDMEATLIQELANGEDGAEKAEDEQGDDADRREEDEDSFGAAPYAHVGIML